MFTFRDILNEFNDNCGASGYSIIYELLISSHLSIHSQIVHRTQLEAHRRMDFGEEFCLFVLGLEG